MIHLREEKLFFCIFLTVAACALLTLMNATVRWLTELGYSTAQIVFSNGTIDGTLLLLWAFLTGRSHVIKSFNRWVAFYMVASVIACFSLFFAFGKGQQAMISAIVSSAPMWIAILSVLFLKERLSRMQTFLLIGGFLGVLLVVKPRAEVLDYVPVVVSCLGVLMLSASQFFVRRTSGTIPVMTFPFYLYVGVVLIGGLLMDYKTVLLEHWPFFFLSAGLDLLSLATLYTALKLHRASLTSIFQYSVVLWGGLWGFLIWSETPDIWTLTGAAVIVLSGVLFILAEKRKKDAS